MKNISIPPLYDHHSHYLLYAALSVMPSLAEVNDHTHACDIIRGNTSEDITIIPGWNSSMFALTPQDLGDEGPVIVFNLSLHGMVMNTPAEEYLSREYNDIVQNYMDPLWTEKNLPAILGMIVCLAPPSIEQTTSFGKSLLESGVGAMDDMLLPGRDWLTLSTGFPIPVKFWADEKVYAALTPAERGKIQGVKLFTDGALGTRTAALSDHYLSGERGILLMENDVFTARLHKYMKPGIPLAIHAIGDMAVDQVVEAVRLLRNETGCSGPVRIEHAQFITRDAAFTAKEAGITLSMQPNFNTDSVIYADRLPRGYSSLNNPFRMLIDKAGFVPGRDMLFGSDGMPHGIQPALQSSLFPPFAGQILTLSEFRDGYCLADSDREWLINIDGNRVIIDG